MAPKNAGLAKKMGYKNVKVMSVGVPGWKKSKRHVVASNAFVKTGNNIIVDVRSPAEYKKGHVARAVNVPLADLKEAVEDDFPKKIAPVVVYGATLADAKKAYGIVKKGGYKKTSVMGTALSNWKEPLATGPSPDEIVWVRKLAKGEITLKDFNAAVKSQSALILDVRNTEETKDGMFKGAKSIPLDQIGSRLGELPKDKEVLIHCTTGARADMAYQELKKAGIKARFLVANVSCEDGQCEGEE